MSETTDKQPRPRHQYYVDGHVIEKHIHGIHAGNVTMPTDPENVWALAIEGAISKDQRGVKRMPNRAKPVVKARKVRGTIVETQE